MAIRFFTKLGHVLAKIGSALQFKRTPPIPTRLLTTDLEMKDLVLSDKAKKQIQELLEGVKKNRIKSPDTGTVFKPGFKCLLSGNDSKNKTLTATLLGKQTRRDVYRVDLSMVVSKYIGETEKNLARLFDKAEDKNWILFFDEADALFGKRTNVSDAHDRFSNREITYLLQRIENYPGLVILATNLKHESAQKSGVKWNTVLELNRADE